MFNIFNLFKVDKQSKPIVNIEKGYCPYCSYEFPKMPSRKRACPKCKQTIHRRKHYQSDTVILFKNEDIELYDEQASAFFTERSLKQSVLDLLPDKENDLIKYLEAERIKHSGNLTALYFGFLNKFIIEQLSSGKLDYDLAWKLHDIYWFMARHLCESENDGWKEILRAANDMYLKRCQLDGLRTKSVEILSKDCCPECQKLNGKILTIKEALKIKPLPPNNCSNEWCNCMYLPAENK